MLCFQAFVCLDTKRGEEGREEGREGGEVRRGPRQRSSFRPLCLDCDSLDEAPVRVAPPTLVEVAHRGRWPAQDTPDDSMGTEFTVVDLKQIGSQIFL